MGLPSVIPLNNYNFLYLIAQGSTAHIYLAEDKQTKQKCAVKVISKNFILKKSFQDHLYHEITLQHTLKHPRILPVLGYYQDSQCIYIFLPYVRKKDLFYYLYKIQQISVKITQQIVISLINVLTFLHEKQIIYRDLKPENILINENGYPLICDFGFAKMIKNKTMTICGTPNYMAPELLSNKGYSFEVDFWALGILVFEMLTGYDPFDQEDVYLMYQSIIYDKPKIPQFLQTDAIQIIEGLLCKNYLKRWNINELKKCSFLRNQNWQQIIDEKLQIDWELNVDQDEKCKSILEDWKQFEHVSAKKDIFLLWE